MKGKRPRKIYRLPWGQKENSQTLIVHLGSKSTPLIAQALREIGLASRIILPDQLLDMLEQFFPNLVILSGGDKSVTDKNAPHVPAAVMKKHVERGTYFLGICYGAQDSAHQFGGTVRRARRTEVGIADLAVSVPFGNYVGGRFVMNHGDEVVELPKGWKRYGSTEQCRYALFGDGKRIMGVLGHPEMDDTHNGLEFLNYIAYDWAGCRPDYAFDPKRFVNEACAFIEKRTGGGGVVVGASGGVDSSVALTIARQALGRLRVEGIFVDTGFLREGEKKEIQNLLGAGMRYVNAREKFYRAVETIPYDSQREVRYYDRIRKIMGECFIDVFVENIPRRLKNTHLIQGTNHADVIESETGLKRHHNVGGLPARLKIDIIEPLAGLFKNEIRQIAEYLELPQEIVWRQPFPGPGTAIRTWGEVTREKVLLLARANRILEEVVHKHYPGVHTRPNQYYVSFPPLTTRGHVGDKGVNGYPLIVRAVGSHGRENYITVHGFEWTREAEQEIRWRFTNELRYGKKPIIRVWFDGTDKPPATVEMH